jgi:hypothetical protein
MTNMPKTYITHHTCSIMGPHTPIYAQLSLENVYITRCPYCKIEFETDLTGSEDAPLGSINTK